MGHTGCPPSRPGPLLASWQSPQAVWGLSCPQGALVRRALSTAPCAFVVSVDTAGHALCPFRPRGRADGPPKPFI